MPECASGLIRFTPSGFPCGVALTGGEAVPSDLLRGERPGNADLYCHFAFPMLQKKRGLLAEAPRGFQFCAASAIAALRLASQGTKGRHNTMRAGLGIPLVGLP